MSARVENGSELFASSQPIAEVAAPRGCRSRAARHVRPDWPALMKVDTAAEYLSMSRSSFDRQVHIGEIPYVLPGDMKWRMFRRSDLDAYLARLTPQVVTPSAPAELIPQ